MLAPIHFHTWTAITLYKGFHICIIKHSIIIQQLQKEKQASVQTDHFLLSFIVPISTEMIQCNYFSSNIELVSLRNGTILGCFVLLLGWTFGSFS